MPHPILRLLLGLAIVSACGGDAPEPSPSEPAPSDLAESDLAESAREPAADPGLGLSPGARPQLFETLRAELSAPRHASDGGGRAWIEAITNAAGEPVAPRAGDRVRIRLRYEAGPLGIAREGSLAFQVSPFFEWDPPQGRDQSQPGYTEMSPVDEKLRPEILWDGQRLIMKFADRALAAGELVDVTYGAGPALARVDRFAERGARLWFGVDGDGDGIRDFIDEPPSVDIRAGAPARLFVVLPTTARPGEEVSLRLSVLDAHGSVGTGFVGEVDLAASEGLELPDRVRFTAEHQGRRTLAARAASAGIFRVTARTSPGAASEELASVSNPLLVESGATRLRWADLHGHSQLSDGTGTPEDYFAYARDVAGLDVVALTDHDHWGLTFLDTGPEAWEQIRENVSRFHVPGRFVTLLGYEWTSLLHGHRHVLYFRDEGEVLSFLDPRYETPTQLWQALRGRNALTFAHHSAGGPIATNWSYRPDPELEPVTEIVSVHGSSEAPDAPKPIYQSIEGNFVRDVLDDGVRFGFIGSGDSHDGHPGASHLDSANGGGLAAIASGDLTRDGILAALRARQVYATNGPRIFLEVSVDDAPMGSVVAGRLDAAAPGAPAAPSEATLRVRVIAESPLERIDLVTRNGSEALALGGELEWSLERPIDPLRPGEYHYIRVVQRDGGAAWSSPIYAE